MKNLPLLEWVSDYKKEYLKGDISAGITVGIMLIPQGMAYALLAGLPPVYGLYAALFPILVYAILGTSRQLAVGPVAMDSLLVASFVSTLAQINSDQYIALAILLATIMGIIQILLGILRMGFLVNFLSKPVINGFTSAAAIIIGFSQLKHLLGADIPGNNQIQFLLLNIWNNIDSVHFLTITIGIVSIITLVLLKKYFSKLPAPLAVVSLSILLTWFFKLDVSGVKIVQEIPKGLPSFSLPSFDWELIITMFPMAGTLALIAFMEAISVAKAIQVKHKNYEINPNRELIALGSANLVGSFFLAYPTTGGFSRTAVNDQAGANTPFASIISVVLVALTLLFLTPLFYYLPQTVLAAIIMVAVYGLIDFQYPVKLWKSRKIEFYMLFSTFIITLTIGIIDGILIGVALTLFVMIYLSTKPHIAVLGRIKNTNQFRNIHRFEGLEVREDILIIRFDAQMYFANAQFLKNSLLELAKQKGYSLKLIILNMESVNLIDSTALSELEDLIEYFKNQNIILYFAGTIGPVRDVLYKSNFIEKAGENNFFLDVHFAIQNFDHIDEKNEELKKIVLQSNK